MTYESIIERLQLMLAHEFGYRGYTFNIVLRFYGPTVAMTFEMLTRERGFDNPLEVYFAVNPKERGRCVVESILDDIRLFVVGLESEECEPSGEE